MGILSSVLVSNNQVVKWENVKNDSLSPKNLTRAVSRYRISMCGPGPVMAMLTATSLLGARKATLLKYATSGDITGDYEAVVGYASVIVER